MKKSRNKNREWFPYSHSQFSFLEADLEGVYSNFSVCVNAYFGFHTQVHSGQRIVKETFINSL